MDGKAKCEYLREVRRQVAEQQGISFDETPCAYQGECKGTCPACEARLQTLTEKVERKRSLNRMAAGAVLGVAIVAMAGCTPPQQELSGATTILDPASISQQAPEEDQTDTSAEVEFPADDTGPAAS